jgi:hypothetical protein
MYIFNFILYDGVYLEVADRYRQPQVQDLLAQILHYAVKLAIHPSLRSVKSELSAYAVRWGGATVVVNFAAQNSVSYSMGCSSLWLESSL